MTPKDAMKRLIEAGNDQPLIVEMLAKAGVSTTQATISRIASGAIRNPGFELGQAIVTLCETKAPVRTKRRRAA